MKRLLSLFLVLILVFTLGLTGCSRKGNKEDTFTTPDINTSDTATNTPGNTSGTPHTADGTDSEYTYSASADNGKTSPDAAADSAEADIAGEYNAAFDTDAGTDIEAHDEAAAAKDGLDTSQYRYWNYNYPYNAEEYSQITEAGFLSTYSNPLSTFSIDVDTASYTNLRKNLNYGIIPEADAIRIEEMLNYFHYDYDQPEGSVPFTINTEIGKCPWNDDNYLLMVGIQGKNVDKNQLPKSNLVFLIDVSGSMDEPDKLPLLKNAFSDLTKVLSENDRVSIVVYAGDSGVVLDSVPGSDKDVILDAIDGLSAGGSTGGAEGLELAYRLAEKNFKEGGNNRVILATDGDFNVGPSSVEALEEIISEKRESGIFLSVMGFGSGNLKDNRLETLADNGNGNYSYIDSVREAKRVLVNEMAGTLLTIAKDVKIQLEFNPSHVSGYRLIGYENRALADEDFNNDSVDAGELGAGHTVTAVYEIMPAGVKSSAGSDLKYQNSDAPEDKYQNEISEIRLRYKEPNSEVSREIKQVVSFKNTPVGNKKLSEDFYFAAAVIEFGMILRESGYLGNSTLDTVMELAKKGLGEDEDGYRLEFMDMVGNYEELLSYQWYD